MDHDLQASEKNIISEDSKTANQDDVQIEVFDGVFLHPSLDIKDNILCLGFRYRSKRQEEKNIFIIITDGIISTIDLDSFERKEKNYYFEKRNRKLMRIEEKWSIQSLKDFAKDYNQAKINVSPKTIFEEILSLTKKYVELGQEINYYLLTAWIIGTYFFPIFYAYPFLHIKAPKRSGKSQCLSLLTQLCFNAIKARPSVAALGDTVDALRGTCLIDQADSLERKGGEDLLDILADSYKKSGGKRRIIAFDKGKNREVIELETFGPKAFASIRELPEDLRDRCLELPLIRSQRNFADPDDDNEDWRKIRGALYTLLIARYELASTYYFMKKRTYKESKTILGRSLELWLPFEVIFESTGMKDKIPEARTHFLSRYSFSEYEPSELEEEVIKAILDELKDKMEIILAPIEISTLIKDEVWTPGETPKQKAAKVGWAIKKFNLASRKEPRTKDGVQYQFEKNKIEHIYTSYCKTADEPTSLTPTDINTDNDKENEM